jgi:HNH endonuclease
MTTYRLKLKLLKDEVKQHQCENCKLKEWKNNKIPLELHHIDGNSKNNDISNIELLCPNCHALTDNYRGRNKKINKRGKELSDDSIANALISSHSKRQALLSLGLSGYGGCYQRVNRIMQERNIILKELPNKKKQPTNIEKINKTKINWPEPIELENMIKNNPIVKVGKMLGVSDNSVRKAAKRYGLNIREINKWSKKHGS